jgi:hypothetical protein
MEAKGVLLSQTQIVKACIQETRNSNVLSAFVASNAKVIKTCYKGMPCCVTARMIPGAILSFASGVIGHS